MRNAFSVCATCQATVRWSLIQMGMGPVVGFVVRPNPKVLLYVRDPFSLILWASFRTSIKRCGVRGLKIYAIQREHESITYGLLLYGK